MHKRVSIITVFSLLVAVALGAVVSVQTVDQDANTKSLSPADRIAVFEKVWRIINDDFYDPAFNGVDWKGSHERYRPRIEARKNDAEFYDLLDEMLAELKDSHTSFHRPKVYSGKKARASNVGVSVFPVDGTLAVTAVDKNSEAAKAGVHVGMVVKTFDGRPVEERMEALKQSLRRSVGIATDRMLIVLMSSLFFSGDINAPVLVGFEAEDGKALEVKMQPLPSDDAPTMTAQRLDSGLGYIRFKPWVPPNDKRFAEEVRKLIDAPGLIIDLRGNRGGSFMTADYFLKPGTFIGTTVWRNGKVESGYSRKSEFGYNGRLVVLVDEESGSASENFAAVIQESGRGLIIGRQTCGCFTSSYYESVKGGGRLQWSRVLPRTIKGRKVEGVGVVPDKLIPIDLSALRQGRDPVLEEAKSVLIRRGGS
jgi:carboxyl-terminal processing protease